MAEDVHHLLDRWTVAGVIDEETAARIRAFEARHTGSTRLRWPVLVALAFGALLVATGILLFVSAHWDSMSPAERFALVLVLVAAFHVAGAVAAERFPAMASALHAIGTAALGAGIFLAGQIFNLDEHWPGGLMLWALGAGIAFALLRQLPQFALLAVLVPAWVGSEWYVATGDLRFWLGARVLASAAFLLALSYFTTVSTPGPAQGARRILLWIGAIALLPAAYALSQVGPEARWADQSAGDQQPSGALLVVGWLAALALPLGVAFVLRRHAMLPLAAAIAWAIALINMHLLRGDVFPFVWWAIGAVGLIAWGVNEGRRERIDMGAALFAFTVTGFYFSEVMDKLGRSLSLVGLGVLFLAGGWALERVRRSLILRMRGHA